MPTMIAAWIVPPTANEYSKKSLSSSGALNWAMKLRIAKSAETPSQSASARSFLDQGEGVLEVGDDVASILTPYGDAEHPLADPELRELLGGELPVARRGRVVDDRVHAAEARRAQRQLEPVHDHL